MPSKKKEGRKTQLAASFNAFDADGSGTLDADELRKILMHKGGDAAGMSKEDVDDLIDMFDENDDGELSLPEFIECMMDMENIDSDEEEEEAEEKEEPDAAPEEEKDEEDTKEAEEVAIIEEAGPFEDVSGWLLCGVGIDGVYANAPFGYEEEDGSISAPDAGLQVKCREATGADATELETAVAAYKASHAGVAIEKQVRLTNIGGKYTGWYFCSGDTSGGGFFATEARDFVGYVEVAFSQYGDDVVKKLIVEATAVEDTSAAVTFLKQVHTP